MIDDLYGDLAGLGLIKSLANGRVEHGPGRFVYFGAEGAFELVIGLVSAGEVGVANKETLAVIVCVDEPARDVVG